MSSTITTIEFIQHDTFLNLPVEQVAGIVRASNTKVCVFPFNGTRRWFLLEHGGSEKEYVEATSEAYIRLYRMLFDHGIEAVVAPIFGSEILKRGKSYMDRIGTGMTHVAEAPNFTDFYREYDVRVHFYGEYRREFNHTEYAYITDRFDQACAQTAANKKHALFYGVFANDATQSIADLAIRHHRDHHEIPTRRQLVEMYYGEYLEQADLFIGFGKFKAFDYPMLNLGRESLYFTAAPSLFMTEKLLREILYDHIYLRTLSEPDYSTMAKTELELMQSFYETNRALVFGVGEVRAGIWYSK
jgi:tuberculosinol/isotuberculosinol synthase